MSYSQTYLVIGTCPRCPTVRLTGTVLQSHLRSVMGPQVPGATLALRENLLPVLAGQTVHPVLLRLTVSHLLPQSYKLLRHLDSLDVAQCVVALSSQYVVVSY